MATTIDGKARSAMNACKHNLAGGSAWITGESREEYDAHVAAQFRQYQPQSEHETHFTLELADAMWRLKRARRMETELLEKSVNPFTGETADSSNQLQRLTRYSQAIERTYYRAYNELKKIIAERSKSSVARVQNELPQSEKPFVAPRISRPDPVAALTPEAEALIQGALDRYRAIKAS